MLVERLLLWFGNQSRALDNARLASTRLARRRVEREEVETFLDRLPTRSSGPSPGGTAVGQ